VATWMACYYRYLGTVFTYVTKYRSGALLLHVGMQLGRP
jgi:hypothetical protein